MLFVSRVCGHSFLPGLFGGEPVVLDAGFNRGEFSRAMMDIYDATAFAVEPSRRLFDARPVCPRLHVWQVALGGREGRTALHVYKDRDATLLDAVTFGEKVREEVVTVWTLGTFLAETGLQTADLLKADIEGMELDLFEAATDVELRRFRQITVEFHDFLWPEQTARVARVKRRLGLAGFRRIDFSLDSTDVLFVRADSLPWPAWFRLRHVVRTWRGLRRIAARMGS